MRELLELLYPGAGLEYERISKMEPDASDLHVKGQSRKADRKQRAVTAGLSAIGAAAGTGGLVLAGHKYRGAYKLARASRLPRKSAREAIKVAASKEKIATGLLPLEAAGLGGELMATKILHGDTERMKKVNKRLSDEDRKRVSRGVNAVSLGAAAAATPVAVSSARSKIRVARGMKPLERTPGTVERAIRKHPNVGAGIATGLAGLQVANLGGDLVADRVLREEYEANPKLKGGAKVGVQEAKRKIDDKFGKRFTPIEKSADVIWEGEFSKVDTDKRQVFGWASIVELNGEPVVDMQGDYIEIDEVEKAAYDYVVKSRKGGNQHQREGDQPLHVSDMIESFVVTPEKIEKMGLPTETPKGWWCGYQINDDETWKAVKEGKLTSFSIHGRGSRKDWTGDDA